jgi:hypothetical protein
MLYSFRCSQWDWGSSEDAKAEAKVSSNGKTSVAEAKWGLPLSQYFRSGLGEFGIESR